MIKIWSKPFVQHLLYSLIIIICNSNPIQIIEIRLFKILISVPDRIHDNDTDHQHVQLKKEKLYFIN